MIAINKKPQLITPAYNEQWFIVSSDQSSVSDFYYIVEITINGTLVQPYNINKRPDNLLLFNAKECVKNYIKHSFNPNIYPNTLQIDKSIEVSIKFTEFYSGATHPLASQIYFYEAFDGCLKDEEFENYNYLTYCKNGFLGYQSIDLVETKVYPNTDVWLSYYADNAYKINLLINGSEEGFDFFSAGVGIETVNVGANVFQLVSIVPIPGDVITIQFIDTSMNVLQEFSYIVSEPCTKYQQYTVYYLGRSGRIQFKHFDLASTKQASNKVNTVRLQKYYLSGTTLVNNNWDRELHNVSSQTTFTGTLISDWMTETQKANLDELFDSPIVWLYDGTKYEPITIKDTQWQYNKHVSDKLINATISFEYSQNETRQRGL